jgi:hypothetical protein
VLLVYLAVFTGIGLYFVYQKKNLWWNITFNNTIYEIIRRVSRANKLPAAPSLQLYLQGLWEQ